MTDLIQGSALTIARHICCRALGLDPPCRSTAIPRRFRSALFHPDGHASERDHTTDVQQIEDALANLRRLRGSLDALNPDALHHIRRSDPAHVAIDARCACALFRGEATLRQRIERDGPNRCPDTRIFLGPGDFGTGQAGTGPQMRQSNRARRASGPGRRPDGAAHWRGGGRRPALLQRHGQAADLPDRRPNQVPVMLAELFGAFGIEADTRRPAEWAIRAVRQISTK